MLGKAKREEQTYTCGRGGNTFLFRKLLVDGYNAAHMASIRKHGNRFQIRYYSDEKLQQESVQTIDEAKIRAKEIELSQAKGLHVEAKPQNTTFAALADAVIDHYEINELRSADDIHGRFRLHLIPFFGERRAGKITGNLINEYIKLRKTEGASNGTVNRELEALKRAYNLGLQQGTVLQKPYIARLEERNVRTGFFTREEVDRLCSKLKPPLARFTLFGFLTAWRYDEIRNLKWSNVDLERGQIRLDPGTTKNGQGRVFPITVELRQLLDACRTTNRFQQYVFTIRGNQIGSFRKAWNTACHKAGLPCIVDTRGRVVKSLRLFHDLRRSGVRELAKILGERRAMARTGHLTRSVFDRYNVVSDFDLAEDVQLLNMAKNMAKDTEQKRKE